MRNFDQEFEKSRSRFNVIFTVASVFIAIAFTGIVAAYILFGYVVVKSADEVQSVGLKAVVEKLWCGPNAKCL